MDTELQPLDPKTGNAPETRIKDVTSLNAVIKRVIDADQQAAINRIPVQKMVDGAPPFNQDYLDNTGQEGRCNLNFGDGKARLKLEASGYYDLTESVPTLAFVQTDFGDPTQRAYYNGVISEEFHRMLKSWKQFDIKFQLLVQNFITHGLGFLYFRDDVDWHWEVAGLSDFKIPRSTTNEDDCDIAVVLRDVTVSKLYKWIKDVPDDDTRWNKPTVQKAIMEASGGKNVTNDWGKFQEQIKNNDLYVSATAQQTISIAYAWVREYSGKISQYITLKDGSNTEYLFKAENVFECVNECFNFFLYEIGTNGLLHSTRGLGHEIYGTVQVLNSLRCQSVDNAKLSGSLLLQPNTEMDAEDMAILFYGGAAYIPPNIKVQNATLAKPTNNIMPVLNQMSLALRTNSGDTNTQSPEASQREKTKFEVQGEMTKEGILPTANMNLFYQPWGRHINEVWRRVSNKTLRKTDPGAKEVFELRQRCIDRRVPIEAIYNAKYVTPVRAIGYGSPTARLLALDEFLQYYGSLDPVGQNNLLRDRFALRVGYGQVDRYVPTLEAGGRVPVDIEIAELQNDMMSGGGKPSVRVNDMHILHLQVHFPSIQDDLTAIEGGQGSPELLAAINIKIQHIAEHMKMLKPDKLNKGVVNELQREFNNTAERVTAANKHAQVEAEKNMPQGPQMSQKERDAEAAHQQKMRHLEEEHQLKMRLDAEAAAQKRATADADSAARLRAQANRTRVIEGAPPLAEAPEPVALPAPAEPIIPPTVGPTPAPAPTA
jgi:hypothetical protein